MSTQLELESNGAERKESRQSALSQVWRRLILFNTVIDSRFEDVKR